jgi:hypothetical protein
MELARREVVNDLTPSIIQYTKEVMAAKEATGGWVAALALVGTTRTSGDVRDLSKRIEEINADLENYERRRKSGSRSIAWASGVATKGASPRSGRSSSACAPSGCAALAKGSPKTPPATSARRRRRPRMQLDYQSLDPRRLKPSEIAKMQAEALEELKKQETEYTVYIGKQELERRDIRLKAIHEQVDQESHGAARPDLRHDRRGPGEQAPGIAAHDARLSALRESFKTEEELAAESYNTQLATVQEFSDEELKAVGGRLNAEARLARALQLRCADSDRQRHAASGRWRSTRFRSSPA